MNIKNNVLKRILALLLAFSLCIVLLAACAEDVQENDENEQEVTSVIQEEVVETLEDFIEPDELEEPEDTEEPQVLDGAEEFDLFMDELLVEWMYAADAISMNFFIADPEAIGLVRPEISFGTVTTQESIEQSREDTMELANSLDEFTRESLRDDQRIVYDILRRSVMLSEIMSKEDDFFYFTGIIRPLNGIQVQLPILLAEFNFYTVDDIERYLELIQDTYRYFGDIIEFERERVRRGFFLNDANVDNVTEQIESFIEDRENNLLITIFNERIEEYYGLSDEQRERFMEENEYFVLNNVLPAYDKLLEAMHELRGVGARSGGFANLPGGVEYAHALLRQRLGSDKSIDEFEEVLASWFELTWFTIIEILQRNPELSAQFSAGEAGQLEETPVEQQIFMLRNQMRRDFPQIEGDTGLVIQEVHESLQDHVGPAFFLSPAIDRFDENVVYMNPASTADNLFFFTVLGHESYPGHMYQMVYFRQQSPHPIRHRLSNIGYTEGWATYAEMFAYFFADIDYEESSLFWNARFFDMLLGSHVDFSVNFLGWDLDDVIEFLEGFGITDIDVGENLYNRVTAVPLNSLWYSLGFIEMIELRNEAERALGDDFTLLDFHTFFLEIGPAPFPIITEHMLERIELTGSLVS